MSASPPSASPPSASPASAAPAALPKPADFNASRAPRRPFKALADSFYGRQGAIWAGVIAVLLLLLPAAVASSSYVLHLLFSVFVFALLGHAWNLLAGYAGLLTFGQQVFIGLGGFAQALVFYYGQWPIWLSWPVSGIASLLFAWLLCLPLREGGGSRRRVWTGVGVAALLWIAYEWLIAFHPEADVFRSAYVRRVAILLLIFLGALPLFRLQGAYFAVATWLIAESVASVFNGWNVAGAGGGMQLKSDVSPRALYYVALVLLILVTAAIWRWMRSSYGLALTAIRDDEEAARSSGIDVGRVKSTVFLFGAGVTGLASGLYFMDVVIITPPSAFSISWASYIVFIAVAGGMGTVAGPVIGAVLFIIVDRLLGAVAGQGLLVLGGLSILLMLLLPRGLMGVVHDLRHPRRSGRGSDAGWMRLRRLLLGDDARSDRAALSAQPGVVGAYLLPGSPLLALQRDVPAYAGLVAGMAQVAREIEELAPDTLVIYSTRWLGVLDQQWQGRARITGLHVDDNWHEYGEMRYDLTTDVSLARACMKAANRAGIHSKLVDYAGFPIDSGTLTVTSLVDPEGRLPMLVVANNLYLDDDKTRLLGELAGAQAAAQGKRVVVLAVGELSGTAFRDDRPLADDRVASATDDDWNRRILKLIERRDLDELARQLPDYRQQAKPDMGFKHFAFALGALGGRLGRAEVLAYGPQYGTGAAVVRLL